MKATLTNYRQAPRKVRLVADAIRGKSVADAVRMLTFMPKYAAPAILKLLNSAVSNARNLSADTNTLFVKTITVDKGLVSKRGRPFARGRSGVIRKTMSHIYIELESRPGRAGAPSAKKTRKAKATAQ